MKTFKQYITEEIVELSTKSGVKYHVHKDYAKRFQGLVKDLEDSGYHIHSMSSHRPNASVAGTGRRSAHADGMAIDINPRQNPHTHPHHRNYGQTDMPELVTKSRIHKKHGLGWGGEWRTSRDTMHFSAHPREGGAEQWTPPDEVEEPKKQEPPKAPVAEPNDPKTRTLTGITGNTKKISVPAAAQADDYNKFKPTEKDFGAFGEKPTKKPEQPAAETPPEQPKPQAPEQKPDESKKRWADVRAAAGYSARQSVTSDPELLNLYNKWKEGSSAVNESIERFVRRKYTK